MLRRCKHLIDPGQVFRLEPDLFRPCIFNGMRRISCARNRDHAGPGQQKRKHDLRYAGVVLLCDSAQSRILGQAAAQLSRLRQWTICHYRDLPLLLRGDAVLTAVLPKTVRKARFAVPPGNPAPPLIADGSREAWEKTGCLTLHFSTMLWQSDIMPLKILKELIRNYSPRNTEETEKLLDGITELQSAPEVFRFIRKGCIFFENGWKLRLTLDETCCVGTGFYIFACVLRKLLESYAPLNTPVRLELFTKQQGRITEWTM